ncbi:MAG: hypothetical protein EBS82_03660, partial [Methylocystaceae bacterium]|nr:hypothetical protein [Methylocystaceae bacterium]
MRLAPTFLPGHAKIKVGKRSWKELQHHEIAHDCRLVRERSEYYVMIPLMKTVTEDRTTEHYCGVDMGIRTFATAFGSRGVKECDYRADLLDKLNRKLDALRAKRARPLPPGQRLRTRRRNMYKYESRKDHLVDELHWKTIRTLLTD